MTTSSVPADQAAPDAKGEAEAELAAGLTRLRRRTSVVATKTGSMFHRPECPVVAGRPDDELRKVELPAAGMSPCKLCSPLEAPA